MHMSNEERILSMLTDIGQRLDKLEAGQVELKAGQAELKAGQAELKAGQAELKAEMNNRFDAVNAEMNSRFDAVNAEMNSRFDAVNAEMNSRFDTVNADLKKVLDFALDAEEANEKRHKEIFKRLEEITLVTKDNTYDIALLKYKAM